MTDSNKDQVENFISSFIALAYLALAAYCAAILYLRIQRRRRVAKQQLADAEKAAARGGSSSAFMPKSPSRSPRSESVTFNLSTGYGATDTSIASLQQAAPTPVVWDVGSWFYIVTIIEASIRATFFLASTSDSSSLSNNSDAQFQTFGLADALFPLVMFLLLYLWFSTLWRNVITAINLEGDIVDPLHVPRLMTMTGVVVAAAIAQHIAIAIGVAFVKIPDVIKDINQGWAIFTYLTLAGMFIVVGSQIHRSVVFIPVSDNRLTTQAALVYRVSHIAASGLFVRSCMIGVQFVSQFDYVFSQPWFAQGFYFFFDYCVLLLVVASVHKRTRR